MSESAMADSAYYQHTLTAGPYFFPSSFEARDSRLAAIIARLHTLPLEIRLRIFELAFQGNRVAVTTDAGCYCASSSTGPYRADHQWLLKLAPREVRSEALRAFIRVAIWEVHCDSAVKAFVQRMKRLGYLDAIRHVRLNVYEEGGDRHVDLTSASFPKLRTTTFAPWQKDWTITIAGPASREHLSDQEALNRLWQVLDARAEYQPMKRLFEDRTRRWRMLFVFPVTCHVSPSGDKAGCPPDPKRPRWQLCVWRADLDNRTIERDWREVHLVQEATLD
jgi:hypothetical protein